MLVGGNLVSNYISALERVLTSTCVTDVSGTKIPLELAICSIGDEMRDAHGKGNHLFFVGNGGSAAICSHLATDFSKNAGIRAMSLNDSAALTCLSNDLGYEHVFSKQLEWHAQAGDIVVIISSSGQSPNVLNALRSARKRECRVFTLSGFNPDNPLRGLGDVNFYLANQHYGLVEVAHLALMHSVLDIQMGWQPVSKGLAA
jgi:D-sedoheptulose 7-phosphate isomerase